MKKSNLKIYLLLSFAFLFSIFLFSCNHTHYYYTQAIVTEPTCSSTGFAYRICDCGETQDEILPALNHDFSPATCTLSKTCNVCQATEGEPNGHTEQVTNCNGTKCSVCDAVIKEPLLYAARTTTNAVESAAIILFLRGKLFLSASMEKGYSLINAPPDSAILSKSSLFSGG